MMDNIKKMILDYQTPAVNLSTLAKRSLDHVSQFTDEIRAVYQYLFDDEKINQLLIDILVNVSIGENEQLNPVESFTTFEKQEVFIPREIVLPKIKSSLQTLALIGESARIMKNQNPKEEIQNEILTEFLKTIASELISRKTNHNQNLGSIFKILQIKQIQQMISKKENLDRLNSFSMMICLREEYRKYPKEVLYEIKKVLLNYKTTNQILTEGNINFNKTEEYVYQYLH